MSFLAKKADRNKPSEGVTMEHKVIARIKDVLSRVTMPSMTFHVDAQRGVDAAIDCVIYGIYLQVKCDGKCNVTGEPQRWSGRKWLLSEHMTDQEIVQTALKAVLTAQEHETREMFKYRGVPIFDPHYDIEALVALRESGAVVQREKPKTGRQPVDKIKGYYEWWPRHLEYTPELEAQIEKFEKGLCIVLDGVGADALLSEKVKRDVIQRARRIEHRDTAGNVDAVYKDADNGINRIDRSEIDARRDILLNEMDYIELTALATDHGINLDAKAYSRDEVTKLILAKEFPLVKGKPASYTLEKLIEMPFNTLKQIASENGVNLGDRTVRSAAYYLHSVLNGDKQP